MAAEAPRLFPPKAARCGFGPDTIIAGPDNDVVAGVPDATISREAKGPMSSFLATSGGTGSTEAGAVIMHAWIASTRRA